MKFQPRLPVGKWLLKSGSPRLSDTTSVEPCIQSTLSKADTLGTKATVRFREVSALERVQVTWYPNLQFESWAFVQCTMTTWWTGCVSFSRPNGTQHSSYEFVYFIKTRDVPVIRLRYFQVCYKFVLTSGVRFERFRTKILKKKVSAVRLREVSALERVQLQRYTSAIRQGPNLLSALERCPA